METPTVDQQKIPLFWAHACEDGAGKVTIRLPENCREGGLQEVAILNDVFLIGRDALSLWNHRGQPAIIRESVHYSVLDHIAPDRRSIDRNIHDMKIEKGEFAILANIWSRNYYHWFEELLRVCVLEQAGFSGRYIVHAGPLFITESLEVLGIAKERIQFYTGEEMRLERVWITPQTPIESLDIRPALFWNLRSGLLRDIPHRPSVKLMMMRCNYNYRHPGADSASRKIPGYNLRDIVNIEEVVSIAKQFDFSVFDLASLAFIDQIAVMNSAVAVMGMHGAAFVNCMFMKRRSSVVEFFSPEYVNFTTLPIMNLLSHRYIPVVSYKDGAYKYGENAFVNIGLLRNVLNQSI